MTTVADYSPRFRARLAGFFYLLLLPIGGIQWLGGRLPASSDAAVTAANMLAHPSTVYCYFLTDLLVVWSYVVVTALLYELFEPAGRTLSLVAALFSLSGCCVQAVTALFRVAPLTILRAAQSSTGLKKDQVDALAYLLLKLYAPAYGIAFAFFGMYMVLIGCLIYKSTFMPRLLGVLVIIAGCGGLTFLWPPLTHALWPRVIMSLDAGELALIVWLVVKGVDAERWHERAGAAKG